MCGIYGIISLVDGERLDRDVLRGMAEQTVHRGPDGEGAHVDGGMAMGMRRLSIIDLAGGQQPIANEDGTLHVVCNGEIYNFRRLRAELQGRGHVFRTGSDSEVLLHLYEEHGDDFVQRLDGMFGFALWDSRRRRLLVGRDRLGIKPLYYLDDGRRVVFASEIKALLRAPRVLVAIDPAALDQYLALGYVPAPLSILRGVRKLPVASMLIVEDGRRRIETYWTPPAAAPAALSEDEWVQALREQLEKSVVSQMVSDVPIGAFLSGGIDSSAVVAFMARNSDRPVQTYSIGFSQEDSGSFYNELDYARQVARLFGTRHREIVVRPDVCGLLPRLLWHMDEPIADSAFITTYLVAEFARQDVKVILSGVGGDELFGGYRRYLGEHYIRKLRFVPGWLRRGVLKPLAGWLPGDRHSKLLNLARYAQGFLRSVDLPFEERYRSYVQVFDAARRRELIRPEWRVDGAGDAILDAFAGAAARGGDALRRTIECDLMTQLPDDLLLLTDKMTMATSLECRVPLLDQDLVDLGLRMPSHMKIRGRELKHVLKRALEGILPPEILHRPKRGFGAPMGAWVKKELAGLVDTVLGREAVERRGLLDWSVVEATRAVHAAGREDNTDHLLALLHLEIWCCLQLDGQSPDELSARFLTDVRERNLAGAASG